MNTDVLIPADHSLRDVTVNYSAIDNCGPVTGSLTVTSNEPETGTGTGDIGPDWEIVNDHQIKFRAERADAGNGRIYTINIKVADLSGNTATQNITVKVPASSLPVTKLTVYPNPTRDYFSLYLFSISNEPFNIIVTDMLGRVVDKKRNVSANSNIRLGHSYLTGMYIVEAAQGNNKK
ncbi:MAG: T9SS type A sorting domain-containing protein, partial [Ferruginibacter sp.]